jgi:hypothetical protein
MVGQEELEVLLNKMFEVAGYEVTYSDIVTRKDNWYNDFIMTGNQQEEWMKWGKKYLKNKVNNPEITMILVNVTWGIKVLEKQ